MILLIAMSIVTWMLVCFVFLCFGDWFSFIYCMQFCFDIYDNILHWYFGFSAVVIGCDVSANNV